MLENQKIKTKIFLVFFITALILAFIGISISHIYSRNSLKEQITNHLETTVQSRAHHIKTWLKKHEEIVERESKNLTYKDLLENPDDILMQQKANKTTSTLLKSYPEALKISIIDVNGTVVASSDESSLDTDKSETLNILKTEGVFIKNAHMSKGFGVSCIDYGFPIYDNENIIGGIIADIALENLNDITLDRTGLGETGETYLVGKDYLMISDSIFFEESTILKQKVDTENARKCFSMAENPEEHIGHEAVSVSTDYRGVNVLGTHVYITGMDWCLLAEIDSAEAFKPLNRSLLVSFTLGLFIMCIVYFISIWFGRKISRPIESLHRGTDIIEKGNLDYKVSINSQDEIGQLSRSFDKMTKSIKKSRAEVDKKVKEQTKNIKRQKNELENQQKAILNILEDVEEEKEKLSIEKDKINAILHSIGDGVFVVDKNHKIIMFNQIAADISGFSPTEVIGKRYDKTLKFVYQENNKKNDIFIKEAIKTGEIKEMSNHTVLIRKDGSKMPVADSAAPLRDKKRQVIGCVVVFRDTTKEQEIDRMKTEFVSLASHQLRTPLTAIRLYLEMLIKEKAGILNTKQKKYIENVNFSTLRMIKLVNDLLNVSRLETGRLIIRTKPTQLEDFIQDIINEVKPLEKKRDCKIIFKKPKNKLSKIPIDPILIRQVIHNLLTNAIRYSPIKQSKIYVKLEKKDQVSKEPKNLLIRELKDNKFAASNIQISVKDNGIGIPSKVKNRIFEKFFRADNAKEYQAEGSGLGIYISKLIMKANGGKIWFTSQKNKGTIFFVSFPIGGMKNKKGDKEFTN